jgi:hypothetical protein
MPTSRRRPPSVADEQCAAAVIEIGFGEAEGFLNS